MFSRKRARRSSLLSRRSSTFSEAPATAGATEFEKRYGHQRREALSRGYDELGFGRAAKGDEVFRQLVLARIIETVSKLDSLRVLEEAGITPGSYATLRCRLPAYARQAWRQ